MLTLPDARWPILSLRGVLLGVALSGLMVGITGWASGAGWHPWPWAVATALVLAALAVEIVRSLSRGEVGLDLVAALSMSAALAFGEMLAGNVVALMYAGGQFLEGYAAGRARREMTALLGRVAHSAMRYGNDGLDEVLIQAIVPGDRLLVRRGEVIPVDGSLASPSAVLDESALTGESLPRTKLLGDEVLSGATNAGDAFDLLADRPAAESTYANIVRLVTKAQEGKPPSVRAADRYAVWFLLLTVLAAGTAWAISGDPVRVLAVLVVATPCPLILALPVAIISGMSRAAKLGVLVKDGGALETLAKVKTVILDKTGTLTFGQAEVVDVRTVGTWLPDEVLRLAASLDQASGHVTAAALVADARRKGLPLSAPTDVSEVAGTGIKGIVERRRLVIGGSRFVRDAITQGDPHGLREGLPWGSAVVAVGVDGVLAGIIAMADAIRPEAPAMLRALEKAGIDRVVIASGDRQDVVDAVAARLGIAKADGELDPAQKVEVVTRERMRAPVLMAGDGVNDAPALASADVGVALGARGSAASSESAGVVILVDRIDSLASAVEVAHRTRQIATQSVVAGLGLSVVGMAVAALGYLPPVAGALVQEGIDVAVILNALRALR